MLVCFRTASNTCDWTFIESSEFPIFISETISWKCVHDKRWLEMAEVWSLLMDPSGICYEDGCKTIEIYASELVGSLLVKE